MLCALCVLWLVAIPLRARAPIAYASVLPANPTKDELKVYAAQVAQIYGINPTQFVRVIECESGFERYALGDNLQSFGLVQMYRPWAKNPAVAIADANNPAFALNWMAQMWVNKQQGQWTCYRTLYGK